MLLPLLLASLAAAATASAAPADRVWFDNNVTREATWVRPPAMPYFAEDGTPYWLVGGEAAWVPADRGDAWRPRWAPDGRPFFERLDTQETTWERPASLGWTVRSATKKFYHNTVTEETTRERPAVLGHHSEEHNATYFEGGDGAATWDAPEDAAWREVHSEEHGRPFYHNDKTGDTVWEPPAHANVAWQEWFDSIDEREF